MLIRQSPVWFVMELLFFFVQIANPDIRACRMFCIFVQKMNKTVNRLPKLLQVVFFWCSRTINKSTDCSSFGVSTEMATFEVTQPWAAHEQSRFFYFWVSTRHLLIFRAGRHWLIMMSSICFTWVQLLQAVVPCRMSSAWSQLLMFYYLWTCY